MTRTTEPPTELGFELERFEFTAADRLEVTGRWFGVRGRRFVRPVMNLRVDGRRRRLIALLDHKPWAADAEGPWIAAFAWRGEHAKITNTRLEVAPDVVLELPPPGDEAAGAILHPRPPRRERKPRPAATPAATRPRPRRAGAAATPAAGPRSGTATRPRRRRGDASAAARRGDAGRCRAGGPSPRRRAAAAPASPPRPTPPRPPPPPSAALADAERRLAAERAARERLEVALREAEARAAALGEHHEAAVERANELVRLEGELAAAREHIERVERDRVSAHSARTPPSTASARSASAPRPPSASCGRRRPRRRSRA